MSGPDYLTGLSAQLACLWEVTARKPGNVHRFRDFEDTTFLDFAASAAAIAPHLAIAYEVPIGEVVYHCARNTLLTTGRNTNLGIILLLAPLAKAVFGPDSRREVERVLGELTVEDSRWVYDAIRRMNPGGLGKTDAEDVRDKPTLPLREAMALAAGRDSIARQYANGFHDIYEYAVPELLAGIDRTSSIEGGIIYVHLHLMSRIPDTLIARKRGPAEAREAADRARRVLDLGWPYTGESRQAIVSLDDWLRAEGNSRNPGTTADLIAAALFVLLRTGRLTPRPDVPWALPPSLLP